MIWFGHQQKKKGRRNLSSPRKRDLRILNIVIRLWYIITCFLHASLFSISNEQRHHNGLHYGTKKSACEISTHCFCHIMEINRCRILKTQTPWLMNLLMSESCFSRCCKFLYACINLSKAFSLKFLKFLSFFIFLDPSNFTSQPSIYYLWLIFPDLFLL